MRWTKLFCVLALCVMAAGAAQATPLQSPWDRTAVKLSGDSYACPALKALPKDIAAADFYSDAKKSVIDAKRYEAYKDSEAQFQDALTGAEKAADTFRATGSRAAAACVLQMLSVDAAAGAMTETMSTNQANYVQNWTLGGLAVAWLKVRSADPGTAEQRKDVTAWMDTVGKQVQVWFAAGHEKGRKDGTNNHFYWAGFAGVAAAVSADDRALFDWGMSTYADALTRITPDGTLPLEMDRGQKALHYHLFAIAPIIMLAEFGEANGQHAYAAHGGIVHMLIKRTAAGLVDNSFFTKAAGVKQDTPEGKDIKSTDVVVLVPYVERFPDDGVRALLSRTSLRPYSYLGGLPPGWPLK